MAKFVDSVDHTQLAACNLSGEVAVSDDFYPEYIYAYEGVL